MISCRLDVSDVADNFVNFQAKSIIHLVTQLDEISHKIQLLVVDRLPEIDVYIELNGISTITSADSRALCNFVSAKTDVLYRLHLQHDESLSQDIVSILQKRLDISFWRANSTWHQKKSSLVLDLPLNHLLSALYPYGLPAPNLIIQQTQVNPIKKYLLESDAFPELKEPRPPIAVLETKVNECKKIILDGQSVLQKYQDNILDVMPQPLIAHILACIGSVGLAHFCEKLSFLSKENLQNLMHVFFSDVHLLDMLDLLTPRGVNYLKICAAWPENLIVHWLHWLNNNSGDVVSFFDAVTLMDYFWQKIKHRHPEISLEKNQGAYPFVERLSEMLGFLEALPEESRKIQISFIFSLDWIENSNQVPQLERYLEIVQSKGLIFICKSMLQQPLQTMSFHSPLAQPNESSCWQYIAQHLQDKSQLAIQTIQSYLKDIDDEAAYQLVAWCACVSTTISRSVFQELYQMISLMNLEQKSALFSQMYSLHSNRRLSTDELKVLLSISNSQAHDFIGLILFYRTWLVTQQEDFHVSWQVITNYLLQEKRSSTLDLLFSQFRKYNQLETSSKNCYFLALICCLGKDEDKHNTSLLQQVFMQFSQLPDITQSQIVSVITTYDFSKRQHLSLQAFLQMLSQNIEESSLESLFNHFFPDSSFIYFKSAIDYQLVFNSIEDLISSVQESINFFLSDEKIFGILKIKSLLLTEVHLKLQEQQQLLSQFLKDLKYLKMQKNEIDLSRLFNHLKEFEVFFLDFINWKLGRIFGENSWLLSGFALSGPLIHQLDPGLNANSTLRDLMDKVLKHHQLVSQSPIGYHFQFEILRIMITPSDIPLLQRYLDNRLVKGIVEKLNLNIVSELSESLIPSEKLAQLSKFLHQLPLEQAGLNAFFQRYQAIKIVLKTWLVLEERLRKIEIDPESVWEILIRHQLHNGHAYAVAHWQVGMSLLNHLIDWHTKKLIPLHFPILPFVDGFFAAKNSLKSIELHSTGDVRHIHWQLLLEDLEQAIVAYGNHPVFLNILPKSIEYILSHGAHFNFEQNLEVFAGFSQNPQLIPRLYQLMNHADREVQRRVSNIFLAISEMLAKQDRRPWQKFLVKLLNYADFEQHIAEIEDLLVWINHESQFYCWIELVAFDENASLSEILTLKNILSRDELIWIKSYEKVYKSKPILESIVSEDIQPEGFFSSIFFFVFGRKSQLVADPNKPTVEEKIMTQAWSLWSKAPYPDIRKLLLWLLSPPQDISLELEAFDCFPLGRLTPYEICQKDMGRWMAELEFYEALPPLKTNLAQRLESILTMINEFLVLPRTRLISQFHAIKKQAIDQSTHQDHLIALLATIYYKSTNRKPYPTQLLTILLTFEYRNRHLIFEVDTGEGKGITTALLAVLKWALRDKATVEVRTANRDLVKQDFYEKGHWQFFKLLNIEHAVIEQDSPLESYREGGIYYTTQDDMMVFHENCRLAGIVNQFSVDILADEVDSLLLDQKSLINLAYSSPEMSDYTWIYFSINQFIDEFVDDSGSSIVASYTACATSLASGLETISALPKSINPIKTNQLIEQYGLLLKQVLIEENKNKIYRLIQIEKMTPTQWQDWLITALYAKTLGENKDYLVEEIEIDGQKMHQVVPYINGEVKYGFELSFQMKSGLTQFLHARLDSPARQFIMKVESQVISQLPALDFRDINSFVGLSGSVGCLSELYDMLESTSARAVRIPRFYPASLKELTNILVENARSLNQTMAKIAACTANPLLIVTEKIEDAHRLYKSLVGLFPKRAIKLLTGQESETERLDWLHANEGYHYAGSANSITVATLICGRGTDIVVKKPYYLEVKQIGILGPRNGVQIKGRTARVNALGSYQVIYSREILLRDWGFLNSHLPPLDVSTLNLWIEKIQDQLIYQNRQNRLHLRVKGWCQKHLFGNLVFCLEHTELNESQKQSYHLFISKELDALTNQISRQSLNMEDYFRGCSFIWKKVLIKFEMAGYEHPYCTQAIFYNSLLADSDNALRLVSQTLVLDSEPRLAVNQQNLLSDEQLIVLQKAISSLVPKEGLNLNKQDIPWYSLIRRIKSWLFDTSVLVNHTNQCLHKSWHIFSKKPSFENWEDFYQDLLSAIKLHSKQEKESIWDLNYWFPSLNPICDWLPVFEQVNLQVTENLISVINQTAFYDSVKGSLIKKFSKPNQISELWQNLRDWWWSFMSIFNSDIENSLQILQNCVQEFVSSPNQKNLQNLVQEMHQAKILFTEASQWRSLRLGYWLYWQPRCQVWLDLANELDELLKTSSANGWSLNDWEAHQEDISTMQLCYRTELLNQAENMASLSQYSFWRSKNQSGAVHKTNNNFINSLSKTESIQQQIHELGKLYPLQIQELYQLFYPHVNVGDAQIPKHAYAMILSIIYAYANPSQSQNAQLHLSAKPMTILIAELQRLSKRRELLHEWDAHQTSIEVSF